MHQALIQLIHKYFYVDVMNPFHLPANIKIKEIYSPIVYAVNDISKLNNETQSITYTKINPTKYTINTPKLDKDYVLGF